MEDTRATEKRNYYEMEAPTIVAQMLDQPPLVKQKVEYLNVPANIQVNEPADIKEKIE